MASPSSPNTRPRISVALCTYNGARYLPQQLASIRTQTRLPEELIVCDDGSSDATIDLIEQFAAAAPFAVRLTRNPVNLGSNRNFEQAIQLCTGDLIALSDQDDLWFPERLARSEQELLAHPECGLVFTDGEVIDDAGRQLGVRLWQKFRFTESSKRALRAGNYTPLARFRFVTGATVMFRAALRPFLFPVLGTWVHDGWIANITACLSGIRFLDEPLIYYRQHAEQQIGLGTADLRQKRSFAEVARRHWPGIDAHRVIVNDLCAALPRLPVDPGRGAARDFLTQRDFLTRRLTLPRARLPRLVRLLPLLPAYKRGANGLLSVGKDFILPKDDNEVGSASRTGFSLF